MKNIIYVLILVFLEVGCQTTGSDKSDREPAQTVYDEKHFPNEHFYTAAGETLEPVNDINAKRTQKQDGLTRYYYKDVQDNIWISYYFGIKDHCEITKNVIYNEATNLNDIVVRSFKMGDIWLHNANLKVSELPGYSEFTQIGDQIFIAGIPYAKIKLNVYDRKNDQCFREIADYRNYPPETKITVVELVPIPNVKFEWISKSTSSESSGKETPYEIRNNKFGFLQRKIYDRLADEECKKSSMELYLNTYEAKVSDSKQQANFKAYNLVTLNPMGCSLSEVFPRRAKDVQAKIRKK